jgi:hypothetical protein
MPRIIWLALLCAPLVGALLILTTIIKTGDPPDYLATLAASAPPKKDDDAPIAKADRLALNRPAMPIVAVDNRHFATIEVEQPDLPPPTTTPVPRLTSTEPSSSTQPQARSHAWRPPPTISRRSRRERIQRVASQGRQIEEPDKVTSWHWHAGSEVIKRAR